MPPHPHPAGVCVQNRAARLPFFTCTGCVCVFGSMAVIEVKPAALTAPAWILLDAGVIAHAVMDVDAIRVPACHYLSV